MSLDQAPPPEDRSRGYKPDPLGGESRRWWDGEKWTSNISKLGTSSSGKPSRKMPIWLIVVLSVVGGLVILGAILGEEEEPATESSAEISQEQKSSTNADTDPETTTDDSAETTTESAAEEVADAPPTPDERVHEALSGVNGLVEDPNIKDVFTQPGRVKVIVETPQGGFEGASGQDMDYMVTAILRNVYRDAEFAGETEIRFTGGLVNSKTGADLPDALTGRYAISKDEAKQIDWSDDDTLDYVIDWSLYRRYLHPAIKG